MCKKMFVIVFISIICYPLIFTSAEKWSVAFFPIKIALLDDNEDIKNLNREIIRSLKSAGSMVVVNSEVALAKIEQVQCQEQKFEQKMDCYRENTVASVKADYFVYSFLKNDASGDNLIMLLYSIKSSEKYIAGCKRKVDSQEKLKSAAMSCFSEVIEKNEKIISKIYAPSQNTEKEKNVSITYEPALVPVVSPQIDSEKFMVGMLSFDGKGTADFIQLPDINSCKNIKKPSENLEKVISKPATIMVPPTLQTAYFEAVEFDNGKSSDYEKALKAWKEIINYKDGLNPYVDQARERFSLLKERVQYIYCQNYNNAYEKERRLKFNPDEVINMWSDFLDENQYFPEKKDVDKHMQDYKNLYQVQMDYVKKYYKYSAQWAADEESLRKFMSNKKITDDEKRKSARVYTIKYLPVFGVKVTEPFEIDKNQDIWGFLKENSFKEELYARCMKTENDMCAALGYVYLLNNQKEASYPCFEPACKNNVLSSCREYAKLTKNNKLLQKSCIGGDGEACYLLSKDKSLTFEEASTLIVQSCRLGYKYSCPKDGVKK